MVFKTIAISQTLPPLRGARPVFAPGGAADADSKQEDITGAVGSSRNGSLGRPHALREHPYRCAAG